MKNYEKILQKTNSAKKEAVALLERCIAIKSYTGSEKGQADLLLGFFDCCGIPAFRTPRGSVAAIISPKIEDLRRALRSASPNEAFKRHIYLLKENGIKTISYNAHMDIAHEGESSLWSSDPFSMTIRDGKIYGRGTCDMKSSLAAMALSLKTAADFSQRLRRAVLGCFVTEEERAEGLAMDEIIGDLELVPDAVLLGEPTDNAIAIAQRGKAQFSLTSYGIRAHTAEPETGKNATYPLAGCILAIDRLNRYEYEKYKEEILTRNTITVTGVETEPNDASFVPVKAKANIIARLAENENLSSLLNKLQRDKDWSDLEVNLETYARPSYTGLVKEWRICHKAWKTDKNNFFVKIASEAAEKVLNKETEYKAWPFSTDGVTTASKYNIPTIGLGPGEEKMCHKTDEYVRENSFYNAFQIYSLIPFTD